MTKSLSTKEAMILAAERRFALHGMEGVSLRQIAMDSGQRNESAAHYHFGSREGLIRAILEHRISRINARRETLLDAAQRSPDGVVSPVAIASVVIQPMADEIFANWRNCYWVRFMSQLFAIDKFRYFAGEFESASPALARAYDLMRALPGIDPAVLDVRREMLSREVVWGLSRIEAMSFHASREICELHVANLVDMIAAGIAAPPSDQTLRKARALGRAGAAGS
ncbi:helix-turn-helix domain-containing protein [Sphingobium sp. AN558]|uniref:TetR/AcrR family transcriptional regulator n=1 Tax=Sphingobium sp. AN558 TaxID=3133442 RepID=UPI0030BA40C8